ncbi:MAG: hypothetical protein P8100_06720, partial [bacterium]
FSPGFVNVIGSTNDNNALRMGECFGNHKGLFDEPSKVGKLTTSEQSPRGISRYYSVIIRSRTAGKVTQRSLILRIRDPCLH